MKFKVHGAFLLSSIIGFFFAVYGLFYILTTVCNQHKFTGKLTRGQIQISRTVWKS